MLSILVRLYVMANEAVQKHCRIERELHSWMQNRELLLRLGKKGYRIRTEDLGLCQEGLKLLRERQKRLPEVVIADIDQDGFLLSHFGPIRNAPTVSESQFLARKRFNLKVIDVKGYVGVRKEYRGNRVSFVNEVRALHLLGLAGVNVPSIMDVDFDDMALTISFILGSVLREELAKKGAVLRNRDLENNPTFAHLSPKEKRLKRIAEGRRVLHEVVDSQFVHSLLSEFEKVHAARFVWNDIKYGNIMIERRSGKPYLIDCDHTRYHPNLGEFFFKCLCDRDWEELALHLGDEELKQRRIKDGKALSIQPSP